MLFHKTLPNTYTRTRTGCQPIKTGGSVFSYSYDTTMCWFSMTNSVSMQPDSKQTMTMITLQQYAFNSVIVHWCTQSPVVRYTVFSLNALPLTITEPTNVINRMQFHDINDFSLPCVCVYVLSTCLNLWDCVDVLMIPLTWRCVFAKQHH